MSTKVKRMIALVVALTYLLSLAVVSPAAAGVNMKVSINFNLKFKDGEQAKWAFKSITELSAKEVIKGYNDGSFRPNKPVTRSEALVMVLKATGLSEEVRQTVAESAYLPFKDARQIPDWAKTFVVVAVKKGYLTEEAAQNFQPNKPATRAWVARLLVRALELAEEVDATKDSELPFTDEAAVQEGFKEFIAVALENSLVQGYPNGTFQPNKPVTRAEMAALLGNADNEMEIDDNEGRKVVGTVVYLDVTSNSTAQAIETAGTNTEPQVQIMNTEGEATVTGEVYDEEGNTEDENDADEDENDADEDEIKPEEDTAVETIGSITINRKNGAEATFKVAKDVQVFVNDQAAVLGDIKVNDLVELVLDNGVVKFIEVKPMVVKGRATVVDAVYNTIKVQLNKGQENTYQVSNEVKVVLNGKSASFNDIKAGAKVALMVKDGEVTAIRAQKIKVKEKVKEKVREKVKTIIKKETKDKAMDSEDEEGLEVEIEIQADTEE